MDGYHLFIDQHRRHADGTVAAHIQVAAAVHEDDADISFFVDRRHEDGAEHIRMAPRLQQDGLAVGIVVLGDVLLLFHHRPAWRVRKSIDDDTRRFSHGMRIDDQELFFSPQFFHQALLISMPHRISPFIP